jgi:hypothetical protein
MTFVRIGLALVVALLCAAPPTFAVSNDEIARLFAEAASQEARGAWSLASSNY